MALCLDNSLRGSFWIFKLLTFLFFFFFYFTPEKGCWAGEKTALS